MLCQNGIESGGGVLYNRARNFQGAAGVPADRLDVQSVSLACAENVRSNRQKMLKQGEFS